MAAHPLSGADPATFIAALRRGGKPDSLVKSLSIGAAIAARAPFSLAERIAAAVMVADAGDMPAPVFIIGHWRSGTTHLYNLLAKGPFGTVSPLDVGLPWDMFGIVRLFRPLLERALPDHRWIDQMAVTPRSPQEDEIALASMSPLSFYHGIYFPEKFEELIDRGLFHDNASETEIAQWERAIRHFHAKVFRQSGLRQLIIKNPVYTARIAHLRRVYPSARFVFVHRDPVDIFLSMRNFYRRLLPVLSLQSVPKTLDIDGVILRVFDRMMRDYLEQSAALPPGDLIEISYSDLDADPIGTVQKVFQAFDLPGWQNSRAKMRSHLEAVRGYQKNSFDPSIETLDRAETALAPWIEKWGTRPVRSTA